MRMTSLTGCVVIFLLLLGGCSQNGSELTITTDSEKALRLYNAGIEKFDNFYMDEARALFGQAVELDSNFAMAQYYWALTSGGNEGQERLLKAAKLAESVTEPERLIILSRLAMSQDSTLKARDLFEKLDQLKPNSKRVQYLIGNFYFQQREWDIAEEHLNRAIEIDPDFAAPYNMLGYLYSNTGRNAEAINALKIYSELRPKDPNPHDSMGEIFLVMGDYKNSIEQYKKALKLESDFLFSRFGIGHNYVFMGEFDKAREIYTEAGRKARNGEDSLNAQIWLITSYLHQEKIDSAISLIDRTIAQLNDSSQMYLKGAMLINKATILANQDKLQEALDNIATARNIIDNSRIRPAAKENFSREILAIESLVYTRLGKRDEANKRLMEYKEYAVASKNRLVMLNYRGLEGIIAYWNKDYETALNKLNVADQFNPFFKYYIASTYLKMGKTEEARREFKELVQFNRNSIAYGLVRPKAIKMIKKIA